MDEYVDISQANFSQQVNPSQKSTSQVVN